jgi:hypothetical protein
LKNQYWFGCISKYFFKDREIFVLALELMLKNF